MKYSRDGNGGAGITNTTAAIPGTSALVTLAQPSTQIKITNYSLSTGNNTTLYVNLTGAAATTASYAIPASPNGANTLTYDGAPISSFTVLGSAAADSFGVLAY